MKALIQRVKRASVLADKQIIGKIDNGLLVFLGIEKADNDKDIGYLIDKIINLRIFESAEGKMDKSVLDEKGELLVVSQFTLCADCRKGRRPDFGDAAAPGEARKIYDKFLEQLNKTGINVEKGQFQSYMEIELINDGPVTIMLESPKKS